MFNKYLQNCKKYKIAKEEVIKFSLFFLFIFSFYLFSIDIDAKKYINYDLPDCGLQKAIDECFSSGGGTVKIPEGVFKLRRGLLLKNKVNIEGSGIDKTILIYGKEIFKINVNKKNEGNKIFLEYIPEKMEIGSAIVLCRTFPPSWYGEPRPAYIKEINKEEKFLTVEAPYGIVELKPPDGCIIFGDSFYLERDIKKGDTEIYLKSTSTLKEGEEIAIGEPPNESLLAHSFIKEIKGNKIILESPVSIDFKAEPKSEELGNKKINVLIWSVFPLIHGANVEDIKISNLTIKGTVGKNLWTTQGRYTVAGIHIYNGKNIVIEKVKVTEWHTDGISLQEGNNCIVRDCEVIKCLGNGIHPGTGLKNTIIENNKIIENGQGIYFCWHNSGHIIRNNVIAKNRSHGIGGLGNPGDVNNLIESNHIYENGAAGIEINGGKKSNNQIIKNIIENNSKSQPGKFPGIMIYASSEDAMNYTIKGNIIRDTQNEKTQYIGIEEKNGKYRDKPTFADFNIIEDNELIGHIKADIIIVGQNTVCKNNKAEKIELPVKEKSEN
ncbi:MAG: right-handed parallel beta-helix repeat-containing protein [Candidatus Omnitrophica bacterium]|nr:right-handed parallel beta-helix repeat-containing protein [Candidatus Omnitrophota bacterium]